MGSLSPWQFSSYLKLEEFNNGQDCKYAALEQADLL